MKKVKRQFMILVLVLALLALGLGGIHIYNERVQAAQDEENDTSTEIFKADPDTITALDCDNNGVQTLSLERIKTGLQAARRVDIVKATYNTPLRHTMRGTAERLKQLLYSKSDLIRRWFR